MSSKSRDNRIEAARSGAWAARTEGKSIRSRSRRSKNKTNG